jgi:hypothetical protein
LANADMATFSIPEQVDLAVCAFDGIDCLLTNDDVVRHFRCVCETLVPGGLYVIDLTHPRHISFERYHSFEYSGVLNGTEVVINWAVIEPRYDLVSGIADVEVKTSVSETNRKFDFHERFQERLFFPQELSLLIGLVGGLEVVAWYGDYDLTVPLDYSGRSEKMVAVIRKTAD